MSTNMVQRQASSATEDQSSHQSSEGAYKHIIRVVGLRMDSTRVHGVSRRDSTAINKLESFLAIIYLTNVGAFPWLY